MMPGTWADHGGRIVQVLRIEGGKSRNWGGSGSTPMIVTVVPWNPETCCLDGRATYTIKDPLYPDLRACEAPEGYRPPPAPVEAVQPRFYTTGEPW